METLIIKCAWREQSQDGWLSGKFSLAALQIVSRVNTSKMCRAKYHIDYHIELSITQSKMSHPRDVMRPLLESVGTVGITFRIHGGHL